MLACRSSFIKFENFKKFGIRAAIIRMTAIITRVRTNGRPDTFRKRFFLLVTFFCISFSFLVKPPAEIKMAACPRHRSNAPCSLFHVFSYLYSEAAIRYLPVTAFSTEHFAMLLPHFPELHRQRRCQQIFQSHLLSFLRSESEEDILRQAHPSRKDTAAW